MVDGFIGSRRILRNHSDHDAIRRGNEKMDLKIKHKREIPCVACPYKLGLLEAVKNPCPECRADGYSAYMRFVKICGTKPEGEQSDS